MCDGVPIGGLVTHLTEPAEITVIAVRLGNGARDDKITFAVPAVLGRLAGHVRKRLINSTFLCRRIFQARVLQGKAMTDLMGNDVLAYHGMKRRRSGEENPHVLSCTPSRAIALGS
ncbi:hypothetical protein D3C80_1818790 [compost metagenome]